MEKELFFCRCCFCFLECVHLVVVYSFSVVSSFDNKHFRKEKMQEEF